jgi:adenosylhomocysteine nucleosidase
MNFNKKKAGVVLLVALESELPWVSLPNWIHLVYTGVGKVNASLATFQAIQQYRPELVLNYGTAGAIDTNISGLCLVGNVIQRDMLAEPLAPRGVTPFDRSPEILRSGHGDYLCGTGDSFVTENDQWLINKGVQIVDMELFAIARVSFELGVPWMAAKFISDHANSESASSWETNLSQGAQIFKSNLFEIISLPIT